jgi:hypothetical protein
VTSRTKLLLAGGAALAVALPALAQEVLLPPGFGNESGPPPETQNQQTPGSGATPTPRQETPRPRPRPDATAGELTEVIEGELTEDEPLEPPPPPVEIPDESRRDPRFAGAIDPAAWGFGQQPWGTANGDFLSELMRRQSTPLPSRWLHITLRNALLARAEAPPQVNPVDWAAERAWLLLRMGEAAAGRMVVSAVDVDNFTPKMAQVAVQSALANADPAGLCPLRASMAEVEPRILPLTDAMCAALEGESASAAAQIDQARRRGRIRGIDLVLADKVVGAGADTSRAVTVEWEPVEYLTTWRFGLATATGALAPDRLMDAAAPRIRAWQARAPLLSPEQRLPAAQVAAGLGVFSSGALNELYSLIYDATDPSDLPGTDAWRLRTAVVGRDRNARLGAMRELWEDDRGELQREASRALLAFAATRVRPDPELGRDAPELIASMLAGGYDGEAARWAAAVGQMDDEPADRAWAMLALGTTSDQVDVSFGRIDAFIGRDGSRDKQRSKLLVAGLAGTGRIDTATASRLNDRHELGLGQSSVWTRIVNDAGRRGQSGSAVVLAAIGMQAPSFAQVPAAQLLHGLSAMRRTGLEYAARMIAAEALART